MSLGATRSNVATEEEEKETERKMKAKDGMPGVSRTIKICTVTSLQAFKSSKKSTTHRLPKNV